MPKTPTPEHGNVLWFILIGVVLIAGLTMTLSRSGSNVEKSGETEKRSIEALYIMRHAKSIENAVQTLKFQSISENDISFQNPHSTLDYTNTNCADNSCKIFHIEGTGLNYLKPKPAWLDTAFASANHYSDWIFTGNTCIPAIGTGPDADCTDSPRQLELIAILPYIKTNLCQQINTLSKITITGANPPIDTAAAYNTNPAFTGAFDNAESIDDSAQNLWNQSTGCFTNASGHNHFYHVLLAR